MLKDFNIEDEARGVGKAVVKNFTTVVTSNTLEIRFYWAGKGTTAIPGRGVYGPLISAITVNPGMLYADLPRNLYYELEIYLQPARLSLILSHYSSDSNRKSISCQDIDLIVHMELTTTNLTLPLTVDPPNNYSQHWL